MMGTKVDVLFNSTTQENKNYKFDFDPTKYPHGMYVIYLRNGFSIQKSKVSILK